MPPVLESAGLRVLGITRGGFSSAPPLEGELRIDRSVAACVGDAGAGTLGGGDRRDEAMPRGQLTGFRQYNAVELMI